MDKQQGVFEVFEVPDPIRIRKAIFLIKNYFKNVTGLKVLECGMAKGGVADLLSREGAECLGIDINPRSFPGIRFIQADLNDKFPDFKEEFDVIFAGEVMEHLFDDNKFVEEAKKVLKTNGLLVITVPNLFFSINRIAMIFGKMPSFAYAPFHYHIYSAKTLERLISSHGFRNIKLTSSHVLFSTRRNKLGKIFEILADFFPTFGAHLIISAEKV